MKRCPNCGGKQFIVSAHVVQEWLVDDHGCFEQLIEDCIEIAHEPDDSDIWECNDCGHEAPGYEFNVKE
jgi:predicted RNA-binding Zn-ribbon protein involved in translation (DUF1610 family)